MNRARLFACAVVILFALPTLSACSTDRNVAAATCADACNRFVTLCGASPPACVPTCESSFDATLRSCVVNSSSCEAASACGTTPDTDAGAGNDMGLGGNDAGPQTCDGVKTCSDTDTVSYCEDGITRRTPCNGHPCAGGRCGSCSSADDCRGVQYRCRCADGSERTGSIDSACGDSQGSMRWCSHPSIDASAVCGAQGFDPDFGYLATGCISGVDP
ncbi:MAG: hypothetical protein IPK60_18515 [Sandaracinaceae bacterium]|jgi:hypothetical protein|nr:hypothetical protein [Sandaracinaceae bacterium]